MPCTAPLRAYRAPGGGVSFSPREGFVDRPVSLPCGQCQACRLKRSREWALRITHEQQQHARRPGARGPEGPPLQQTRNDSGPARQGSCFVTLTYDEEHLPSDGSLDVTHFQAFAKALRKKIGPFRYYQCGEYGETNGRPHHHVCLFGQDFSFDRVEHSKSKAQGDQLYTSETLTKAWRRGMAPLGELTWQSAAYVARYCMAKATKPASKTPGIRSKQQALYDLRYDRIDGQTGEVLNQIRPEFATMSLKPGIGQSWLEQYGSDVYPSDEVIHDGKRHSPPRYYDKLLEKYAPEQLETLKKKRADQVALHSQDLTPERLLISEKVLTARLSTLTRN